MALVRMQSCCESMEQMNPSLGLDDLSWDVIDLRGGVALLCCRSPCWQTRYLLQGVKAHDHCFGSPRHHHQVSLVIAVDP